MSNIPYPDVPPLPGVPPISRLANQGIAVGLAVAAELYALYLKFRNTPVIYNKLKPRPALWGILYSTSNPVGFSTSQSYASSAVITTNFFTPNTASVVQTPITKTTLNGKYALKPDSFIDFEYKEDHKIPNYPIQNGGFASYNKVTLPYEIKLRVTKGGLGNNVYSIVSFLNKIEILLSSTAILTVTTPDCVYNSVSLIHFDYRKESINGATLLIADLTFQEVRVVVAPSNPCASPNSVATTKNGQVSCVTPTVIMSPLELVN